VDVAQEVEHLPSKLKALSSKASYLKKKRYTRIYTHTIKMTARQALVAYLLGRLTSGRSWFQASPGK
jgi:hypothetical protein